jgi:hypothetical protein
MSDAQVVIEEIGAVEAEVVDRSKGKGPAV